jgi:hypothetical protein
MSTALSATSPSLQAALFDNPPIQSGALFASSTSLSGEGGRLLGEEKASQLNKPPSDLHNPLEDPAVVKLAEVCSSINGFYLHFATKQEEIINAHKRKEREWDEEKERIKIRRVELENRATKIQELSIKVNEVTQKNEELTREKMILDTAMAEIQKRAEEQDDMIHQLKRELCSKNQELTALQTSSNQRLANVQPARDYEEGPFSGLDNDDLIEDFLL